MQLMYAFIPIIFLFPPAVLILIVLAFKNRAGIGKSSGSGPGSGSVSGASFAPETDKDGDVPVDYGDMDADYSTLPGFEADPHDDAAVPEFYDDNGAADAGGANDNTSGKDTEADAQRDADIKAEKRYKQLMLAAVLVFITGVILTVTLYIGIKVTPWSGWWPDWLFSKK